MYDFTFGKEKNITCWTGSTFGIQFDASKYSMTRCDGKSIKVFSLEEDPNFVAGSFTLLKEQ